jgi:hypothetical protein
VARAYFRREAVSKHEIDNHAGQVQETREYLKAIETILKQIEK